MYDPTVGRFLTEDPLGFDANDPNLYRYVTNGPTNAVDPEGTIETSPYPGSGVPYSGRYRHDKSFTETLKDAFGTAVRASGPAAVRKYFDSTFNSIGLVYHTGKESYVKVPIRDGVGSTIYVGTSKGLKSKALQDAELAHEVFSEVYRRITRLPESSMTTCSIYAHVAAEKPEERVTRVSGSHNLATMCELASLAASSPGDCTAKHAAKRYQWAHLRVNASAAARRELATFGANMNTSVPWETPLTQMVEFIQGKGTGSTFKFSQSVKGSEMLGFGVHELRIGISLTRKGGKITGGKLSLDLYD